MRRHIFIHSREQGHQEFEGRRQGKNCLGLLPNDFRNIINATIAIEEKAENKYPGIADFSLRPPRSGPTDFMGVR